MKLSDLPRELLAATLQFANHTSLLQLEAVNRQLRDIIVHCDLWKLLVQHFALYANHCYDRSSACWKHIALLTQCPVNENLSLLRQVRECSSVDHVNESAENTLTKSHCSFGIASLDNTPIVHDPEAFEAIAKRFQVECGCARGLPCYWSSASSWEHTSTDHLDYTLWDNCLVNSVQVLPYRVFWYPGSPTYSPKRLSFALYEIGDDGKLDALVYESDVFSIVNDMKMETFQLPCRVFLSRGMLRLNLFDRQEEVGQDVARWMQEYNLPPYYTCLSYVGVTGLLESGVLLE